MLTTRLMGHWMPLKWISFGLDYAVWGRGPFGYHLTNLLLHAINAAVALGRIAALPAFVLPAALGGLVWTQAKVWRDDETVWRQAVRADPRSGIARANLAAALNAHARPGEAMAEVREGIRFRPGYPDAHLSLGVMLAQAGDPAAAEPYFREALRLNPDYAEGRNNLGLPLAQEGKLPEAAAEFKCAAELNPDWMDPRRNLEQAQRMLGR